MRTQGIIAGFVVLVLGGAYGVFGGSLRRADGPVTRAAGTATAGAVERGRAIGSFDPKMSGVCRFSCAASQPFEEADLAVQPDVAPGALTQCPVSGVVFEVDEGRPRVSIETGDYVLCCDGCAKKFEKEPGRFVSL